MKNFRTRGNRIFSVSRKLKNSRKSQAAMEFLMTYGWAILVVLVAIGALAYFGVLSPDKFLPNRCTLPSGLACVDHRALSADNTIEIVVRNGIGFDLSAMAITIENCGLAPALLAGDCTAGQDTLNNGDQCTYKSVAAGCTPTLTEGGKFSGDITIVYTNTDTGLVHTSRGTLTTRAD